MNRVPNNPVYKPSQIVRILPELERVDELARTLERTEITGAIAERNTAGRSMAIPPRPGFWARITDQSPGPSEDYPDNPPKYVYSWREVYAGVLGTDGVRNVAEPDNTVRGSWEIVDTTPGTNFPALEINGCESVPADELDGALVWCELSASGDCVYFCYGNNGGDGLTTNYTGGSTVTINGSTFTVTNSSTANVTNSTLNIDGTSTVTVGGTTTTTYGSSTTTTYNGVVVVQGPYYQPTYAVTAWTANVDDWTIPAGNVRLRVSSDAHYREVRGIAPGASPAGRILCLHNVGDYVILVKNEDTNSVAANRILTSTGNDYFLAPGHEVTLVYDATSSRWRVSENSDERLEGVATYATWSANVDDWDIDRDKAQHRVFLDGDYDLTGIAGGRPGLRHRIINTSTSANLTIKHESASSSAANRFALPFGGDVVLPPRADVETDYDGTTQRWRLVGSMTWNADVRRVAEGQVQLIRQANAARPEFAMLRARDAGAGVTGDEDMALVAKAMVGSTPSKIGEMAAEYAGTGSDVSGRWKLRTMDTGVEKEALEAAKDGKIKLGQAATGSRLIGTDGSGYLQNVTVGTGLSLSSGTLSATGGGGGGGSGSLNWVKVTKTHTDLQAATRINSITLYTLPAGYMLHAVVLHHTAQFVCSTGAYDLEVGISGDTGRYIPTFAVDITPSDTYFSGIEIAQPQLHSFGSDKDILLTASTSVLVQLDSSTAGSVDVYLLVSDLEGSGSGSGVSVLDDLTDVNAPSPTDGQVLTWDDGASEWIAADPTGGVSDGDKGDVTVSSSGATWTVDNGVISNAKLADMATARIKARKTGSTGAPEDCTLSEALDFIGSAAQGDLLYRGASGWSRLAAGTSGQFLKTLGSGADPLWAAITAAGVTLAGAKCTRTTSFGPTNSATGYTIPFTSEDYDSDAIHDNSTNPERMTVPSGKAGFWLVSITGFATFTVGPDADAGCYIVKNGIIIASLNVRAGTINTLTIVDKASVGDYYTFQIWHYAGSAKTWNWTAVGQTSFSATYLGAG